MSVCHTARHFRECHGPASTEIAVDIWCSSSAASRTSLSAIFPVSTQTMLRQAGSPSGDAGPLGGAEITQHLFGASVAIVRARVELVAAKFQDGAKHSVCGRG